MLDIDCNLKAVQAINVKTFGDVVDFDRDKISAWEGKFYSSIILV